MLIFHAAWDADLPSYRAQEYFTTLAHAPDKRCVALGEGTHTVMMEKNRLQFLHAVGAFLTEADPQALNCRPRDRRALIPGAAAAGRSFWETDPIPLILRCGEAAPDAASKEPFRGRRDPWTPPSRAPRRGPKRPVQPPAKGVRYSAACRAPYPNRSFSARIRLMAASAITVPGGKIAAAPAARRAS